MAKKKSTSNSEKKDFEKIHEIFSILNSDENIFASNICIVPLEQLPIFLLCIDAISDKTILN